MNATALYTADKCEVWGPTQNGEAAFAAALAASGLPADEVRGATRSISAAASAGAARSSDYVHQAVNIAKQIPGTPVKLLWSREEDMTHGRYHPVMQCKLVGCVRQEQQPDRPAHAALGPVDPRRRASANLAQQKGRDPLDVPGLQRGRRACVRLHRSRTC